jgi:hypothetical protein
MLTISVFSIELGSITHYIEVVDTDLLNGGTVTNFSLTC